MLDKATICGGLSKVTGPGVTIHYYFAPASNLLYSPTLEMQAKDLLIIINELRSAGAEAISINNHRLLATSPIYYRGNSITVNNHNVSAPYEIRAIGNPDVIYSSLRLKGGEVDNLILLGYKVDIEKNKTIDIPAFTASPPPSPTTDLSRIRQKVPFAVIIPTNVPDGLAPASPLLNPGPPASVSIYYLSETGSSGLLVINSPAGSGLAADERKTGEAIVLRNNISGHFLKNHPEFGGPILWWEESGTYVALSGPQLTKEDLAEIANSMSSDADIRQGSE
ncbi:MAG: DUF881 domain-containing protein [Syntrophomonadaceae bacterium]|nr:DUF881 domain-containing protein [Syntrophomonadaceae bacterium]